MNGEEGKVVENKKNGSVFQLLTLIKIADPPKALFSISLMLSIITTVASLAIPLLASRFIDNFSLSALNTGLIILLIVAFFIQALAGGVSVYILAKVGQHMIAALRKELLKNFLYFLLAIMITMKQEIQSAE